MLWAGAESGVPTQSPLVVKRWAWGQGTWQGSGLTCGIMPNHKQEGPVHDDLLGGHASCDKDGCKRRDCVGGQGLVGEEGQWAVTIAGPQEAPG